MICMRGGHYADMCPMAPSRAERGVATEEKPLASETDVAKSKQAKHSNDKRKQHELLTARMQVCGLEPCATSLPRMCIIFSHPPTRRGMSARFPPLSR